MAGYYVHVYVHTITIGQVPHLCPYYHHSYRHTILAAWEPYGQEHVQLFYICIENGVHNVDNTICERNERNEIN